MTDTLSPLDTLIRSSLLRYPSLFTCRGDVLAHLFLTIGNGYGWEDGRLVSIGSEREDWTEAQCRGAFFNDLDELSRTWFEWAEEAGVVDSDDPVSSLERARRAFQLEHLDELVTEPAGHPLGRADGAMLFLRTSVKYSHAFTVPADVEPSFRAGAAEALHILSAGLYNLAVLLSHERAAALRAAAEAQYAALIRSRECLDEIR